MLWSVITLRETLHRVFKPAADEIKKQMALKEVFGTPYQMKSFYDLPVDSLYTLLSNLYHNKSR